MASTPSEQEFRDIGFTEDAVNYPRDEYGLAAIAAWNNISVEELPPALHYYPNDHMRTVWERVIQAIKEIAYDEAVQDMRID